MNMNMGGNMNMANANMMGNPVNIGGINPSAMGVNINPVKQFVILVDGTSSLRNSFSKLRKEIIDPLLLHFHEKHCTYHPQQGNVPNNPSTIEYSIIIYRSSSYHSENGIECSTRTTDIKFLFYYLDNICFDGGGYRHTHNLAGGLQSAFELLYANNPAKFENYLLLITNSEPCLVANPSFGIREKNAKEMLKTLVDHKCYCSFVCPRELESLSQMWNECTGVNPSKPNPNFSGYISLHSLEFPSPANVNPPLPHPASHHPPPISSIPIPAPTTNIPQKKPIISIPPSHTTQIYSTTISWSEDGKAVGVMAELMPIGGRPPIPIPSFITVHKFIGLNEVAKKQEWGQALKFKIMPNNSTPSNDFQKLTMRLSSRNFGVILLDQEWALLIFVSQQHLMSLLVKKSSIVTPNGANPLV